MLFPILGPSSLPVMVAQLDEIEQLLYYWSCMTDTEHSTTSKSIEEEMRCYNG